MAEATEHHYYIPAEASSIPVGNVQELAETASSQHDVPPRYMRPEAETELAEKILIIDLSRLIDPQLSVEESAKLKFACEEWGFFQLINHGVPEEAMNQMKADMIGFFELPLEEKKVYAQLPNSMEGYGQEKHDRAKFLYFTTRPVRTRKMKFWPYSPPTFRDTLDKYSSELNKVAGILFNMMANDLNLNPEILLNIFKDQPQGLRMNYYPPCPKADMVLGISPHTDADGFTLLLQVSDVHGLQIRKDGKWISVEPLDGALVVNIGDIFEILSNGKYRSIEHRVMVNTEKERLSIAAFHSPDVGCTVGPLPEVVRGGKENYRITSYAEYMKAYSSAQLDGSRALQSMRLE